MSDVRGLPVPQPEPQDCVRFIRALADDWAGPYVYAIQADGYGGDIKIGTAINPRQRLRTLQTGTSLELRGVAAFPGGHEIEAIIHETYASSRIRGEWFMHSPALWRLLRDIGGGYQW